jgi:hypothetical protein
MNEYDFEPVRGLPYQLPEDEKILWQGSPSWRSLAVHLCHIRTITLYFAVLMVWRIVVTVSDGKPLQEAFELDAWLAALLGIVATFALTFAFLVGRTTIYTVTTRRVVLRYGIAFTKAVNVPLRIVKAAGLRMHANGTADIALALSGKDRIAYLILWPHTRPWRFSAPEPMLRAVMEPQKVTEILRAALAPFLKDRDSEAGTATPREAEGATLPAEKKQETDLGQRASEAA